MRNEELRAAGGREISLNGKMELPSARDSRMDRTLFEGFNIVPLSARVLLTQNSREMVFYDLGYVKASLYNGEVSITALRKHSFTATDKTTPYAFPPPPFKITPPPSVNPHLPCRDTDMRAPLLSWSACRTTPARKRGRARLLCQTSTEAPHSRRGTKSLL